MNEKYQPLHPFMRLTRATSFDWYELKQILVGLADTPADLLECKRIWYRTFGPIVQIGGRGEQNTV